MNLGRIPSIPSVPTPSPIPTRAGLDVGSGPLQGNVGVGLPQHLDPNKPAVGVDATIHNPTGIGGDLHVQRDVALPTHIPDVNAPALNLGSAGGGGGGGFGLPDLPSLPSLPDMPNLPDMPTLPDMPDISMSMPDFPSLPDVSLPSFGSDGSSGGGGFSMPSFGMPSFGMPSLPTMGMPGFRIPDLPDFELPAISLPDWDLKMPDLVPDWDGFSSGGRSEPNAMLEGQTDTAYITLHIDASTRERGRLIRNHSLRLYTEDGSYDQTRLVEEDRFLRDDRIDLVFEQVDPNAEYALDAQLDDLTMPMGRNIPGKDLLDKSWMEHVGGTFE